MIHGKYVPLFQMIVDQLSTKYNIYQDVAIRVFGAMAPIFDVSENCSDASWTYLGNFFLTALTHPEQILGQDWVLRSKFHLIKKNLS